MKVVYHCGKRNDNLDSQLSTRDALIAIILSSAFSQARLWWALLQPISLCHLFLPFSLSILSKCKWYSNFNSSHFHYFHLDTLILDRPSVRFYSCPRKAFLSSFLPLPLCSPYSRENPSEDPSKQWNRRKNESAATGTHFGRTHSCSWTQFYPIFVVFSRRNDLEQLHTRPRADKKKCK